jgi:hypothetical protein
MGNPGLLHFGVETAVGSEARYNGDGLRATLQ